MPKTKKEKLDMRRFKKVYMLIFDGRKELYDEFLKYYKEAVAAGSTIPEDVAMIRFRERWTEADDGMWVEA